MTCIVAIIDNNKIYMGSDTRTVDEIGRFTDETYPKVISKKLSKNENILIGSAGDARVGSILEILKVPPIGDRTIGVYMRKVLLKKIFDTIEENDSFLKGKRSRDLTEDEMPDWTIMIHIRGKLFEIASDQSIVELPQRYHAIGSGGLPAKVYLDMLVSKNMVFNPEHEIKEVIKSISKFVVSVGGDPIVICEDIKKRK